MISMNLNLKNGLFSAKVGGLTVKGTAELAPIMIGLEQLRQFQKAGTSRHPEELAWEIRLYEWILTQPDAEAKAIEYSRCRHVGGGHPPKAKRQAVRELGWKIP